MSTVLSPLVSEFETEEQETSYNAWLTAKVEASLADPQPNIPHAATIANAHALLAEKKNRAAVSHETVFGHLNAAQFCASEAAQYLDVSIATFRRYVRAGKVRASSEVGTSHLYPLAALRELKQALALLHGESAH